MTELMQIIAAPGGDVRCIYNEDLNLTNVGDVHVRRVSHVDPDEQGQWWADLALVNGPKLGPFPRRSLALEAERSWLEVHSLRLTQKEGVHARR